MGKQKKSRLVQDAEVKSCIMWMMTLPDIELDDSIAKTIRLARQQKRSENDIRQSILKCHRSQIEDLIRWQNEL